LEKNSTLPFNIESEIIFDQDEELYIINTTPMFRYLIKNINKDKKRLAATMQLYLAKGFSRVVENDNKKIFFAGGMANNEIMSEYLLNKGVIINEQIARGDEGLSWGQINYYLLN